VRIFIVISFLLLLGSYGFGQEVTLPDSIKILLANDTTVLSVKHDVFYTKNGKKIGNWKWFDDNEKVKKEKTYSN